MRHSSLCYFWNVFSSRRIPMTSNRYNIGAIGNAKLPGQENVEWWRSPRYL